MKAQGSDRRLSELQDRPRASVYRALEGEAPGAWLNGTTATSHLGRPLAMA
jgi:hypothetical protein